MNNLVSDIDYVVPMVFPADRLWRNALRRAIGYDDSQNVRYRSWGTEELLIKCVIRFMPWVRHIIILLASESQLQPWMREMLTTDSQATQPRVRVVYHSQFIPAKYLPTFNSRTIEMFLHNIPGISDRFLYGNDDMFPLSPMEVNDFFYNGMQPVEHMESKEYPSIPNNFQRACMRGLNFVGSEFGLHFTDTWIKNGHSISPILKSSCIHLWSRGEQEIWKSLSAFREDYNFNQYIYAWYQYFANMAVDCGESRRQLLKVHTHSVDEVLAVIRQPNCGVVCINDNERLCDFESYAAPVRKAIEAKLME